MIIFGTRGKIIPLASLGEKKCEHCNNKTEFYLVVSFRYFHIFWIPLFITTRSYHTACSICEYGYEIDNVEIDKIISKEEISSPIPWIYKFGWVIPVGAICIYGLIVLALNI